jgi:hypothetical protein
MCRLVCDAGVSLGIGTCFVIQGEVSMSWLAGSPECVDGTSSVSSVEQVEKVWMVKKARFDVQTVTESQLRAPIALSLGVDNDFVESIEITLEAAAPSGGRRLDATAHYIAFTVGVPPGLTSDVLSQRMTNLTINGTDVFSSFAQSLLMDQGITLVSLESIVAPQIILTEESGLPTSPETGPVSLSPLAASGSAAVAIVVFAFIGFCAGIACLAKPFLTSQREMHMRNKKREKEAANIRHSLSELSDAVKADAADKKVEPLQSPLGKEGDVILTMDSDTEWGPRSSLYEVTNTPSKWEVEPDDEGIEAVETIRRSSQNTWGNFLGRHVKDTGAGLRGLVEEGYYDMDLDDDDLPSLPSTPEPSALAPRGFSRHTNMSEWAAESDAVLEEHRSTSAVKLQIDFSDDEDLDESIPSDSTPASPWITGTSPQDAMTRDTEKVEQARKTTRPSLIIV